MDKALEHKKATGSTGYLRQFRTINKDVQVSNEQLIRTKEYESYTNKQLVWGRDDARRNFKKVESHEALGALRLMLRDMNNGKQVNWSKEARGYIHQVRGKVAAKPVLKKSVTTDTLPQAQYVKPVPIHYVRRLPDLSSPTRLFGLYQPQNSYLKPILGLDGLDVPINRMDLHLQDIAYQFENLKVPMQLRYSKVLNSMVIFKAGEAYHYPHKGIITVRGSIILQLKNNARIKISSEEGKTDFFILSELAEKAAEFSRMKEQRKSSISNLAHIALEFLGMIPLVGIAFDAANSILYLTEGDFAGFGISTAAIVPILGTAAPIAKNSIKLGKSVTTHIANSIIQNTSKMIQLDAGRRKLLSIMNKFPYKSLEYRLLRKKVNNLSERIGERASDIYIRSHYPGPIKLKYKGKGHTDIDALYEVGDGRLLLLEAKGGQFMKEGKRGNNKQGTIAYLKDLLTGMKKRKTRGKSAGNKGVDYTENSKIFKAVSEIEKALTNGKLDYVNMWAKYDINQHFAGIQPKMYDLGN